MRLLGRAFAAASFIFEPVEGVSDDGESEGSSVESLARTASKVSVSRCWILSSSAATRSAMWISRVLAREELVWGRGLLGRDLTGVGVGLGGYF